MIGVAAAGREHVWAVVLVLGVPQRLVGEVGVALAEGSVDRVLEIGGELASDPFLLCTVCDAEWPASEACPGAPVGFGSDGRPVFASPG